MTGVPETQEELSALVQELICGNDERAEQAALKIGLHGCEALAYLTPVLAEADPDRRWWAARALGQMPCEPAWQRLIDLLRDPDDDVRACAAFALGEAHVETAVPALGQALTDSSVYVSAMAADALGRIGKASVPLLIERLRGGAALERTRAAKALLTILDPQSIPALIAALDDESPVVEYYAAEALTRLGVGTILIKPT